MTRFVFRLAGCPAFISVLALVACGGGESLPAPGSAAECFNPELFAVGTTYTLDYEETGQPHGFTSHKTTVQASAATGADDRLVVTDHTYAYDVPTPGWSFPRLDETREVQALDGRQIVTKST